MTASKQSFNSLLNVQPAGILYIVNFGWPVSANVYYNRQGRTSEKGRIWRDCIVDEVWQSMGAGPVGWKKPVPCMGKVAVNWEVWMPNDKRRRDQDNFTGKHCLDVLAKASLIHDDCQVWEEHKYQRGKSGHGCVIMTVHEI